MTRTRDGTGPDVAWDGLIAGALGAVTVALWFLILDIVAGHPLYTPTVLGTALFSGPDAAAAVQHARQGTVMAYSAVHLGLFVALGLGLSWAVVRLRHRASALPLLVAALVGLDMGAWVLLRVGLPAVAAEIGGWAVLVGNLLAVAVMGGYFLLRFPDLAGGGDGGPSAAASA